MEKVFHRLVKKNPKQLEIIVCKTDEIVKDPHRYKNLRSPLNHLKRVHIDRHFVLVFSIDDNKNIVMIEEYDHHDKIYLK